MILINPRIYIVILLQQIIDKTNDVLIDLDTRRYCMLAVANMTASQQTHSIIILIDIMFTKFIME